MGKRGYDAVAVMVTGTPFPSTSWIIRTELNSTKRDGSPGKAMSLTGSADEGVNKVRYSSFFFPLARCQKAGETKQK